MPNPTTATPTPAKILIFDSGVGGLTVFREVAAALPGAAYVYVADNAGFPYGNQPEAALIARILDVVGKAIAEHVPDLVVVACNTASTIALAQLRARFTVPFVGTVPAIKPACAQSKSRRIAVLGTQATVRLEYTKTLIREFSAGCDVDLVGSSHLATYAEAELAGARWLAPDRANRPAKARGCGSARSAADSACRRARRYRCAGRRRR
jgi:glutamate racemase